MKRSPENQTPSSRLPITGWFVGGVAGFFWGGVLGFGLGTMGELVNKVLGEPSPPGVIMERIVITTEVFFVPFGGYFGGKLDSS